jgi:hypothetical protein
MAVVLLVSGLGGAHAQDAPGYVGRWANEASWCRNKLGTTDEIPMIFSARGVEGYEFRCRFDRVAGGGGTWRISATCFGEGLTEKRQFELRRQGESLLWIDKKRGTQPMARCR